MRKRVLFLIFFYRCAFGAIAFDGTANSGSGHNTVSSFSYTHTVTSNTNGLLVVCVGIDSSANRSVSNITYNSVGLTQAQVTDNPTGTQHAEIWYLKNPSTGSNSVSVSFPGNVDGAIAGSVSLTGVDQTTIVDASTGTTTSAINISLSITTINDNSWIVDCLAHNSGTNATMTAHTNRTERWNVADASNGATAASSTLGPATPVGSFTMDWTDTLGTNNTLIAVSFLPSSGSLATVTTQSPTSLSYTTATGNGNATSDGGNTITDTGVCWATHASPTSADTCASSGAGGTGAFTASMTSLAENTFYHVVGYATNGIGTSYGNDVVFLTLTHSTNRVTPGTGIAKITPGTGTVKIK